MQRELVELARCCALDPDSPHWYRFHQVIERRFDRWVRRRLAQLSRGRRVDHLAEDLVQEVFLRLTERGCRVLRRCRATSDPEMLAYLKEVCVNVVTDRWRRRHALKRQMPTDPRVQSAAGPRCEGAPDPRADPECRAIDRQLRRELRRQVADVTGGPHARRDREIFELAVLRGWSSREIARRYTSELSVAGIDTVVSRLRRRLGQRGLAVPTR